MRWSKYVTASILRSYKAGDWMLVYHTGFGDEVEPLTDFRPLGEDKARWWVTNLRGKFLNPAAVQKKDVKWP